MSKHRVMYQSIPVVNISPWDPRGFAHPFCLAPRGFTYKSVPGGPGFRRGQIFPEMNENLLNILFSVDVFKKLFGTG